jgi:hypothetical protein
MATVGTSAIKILLNAFAIDASTPTTGKVSQQVCYMNE